MTREREVEESRISCRDDPSTSMSPREIPSRGSGSGTQARESRIAFISAHVEDLSQYTGLDTGKASTRE